MATGSIACKSQSQHAYPLILYSAPTSMVALYIFRSFNYQVPITIFGSLFYLALVKDAHYSGGHRPSVVYAWQKWGFVDGVFIRHIKEFWNMHSITIE